MASKLVGAGSLKKGSYMVIDGHACRVVDTQTSRAGKHGHAKVRILAIGLIDNKKRDVVYPGHDNVEVPIIDKNTAQVLTVSGTTANVMDTESYESFNLEIPEDLQGKVTDGSFVIYWDILGEKVMKQLKSGAEE